MLLETDCPRLPTDRAFTIPMTVRGEELPQILLDLRSAKAYDWKSVILLYDDSLGIHFKHMMKSLQQVNLVGFEFSMFRSFRNKYMSVITLCSRKI